VVGAAIEANPALGNAILSAISGTSQTEQLAILNRVSFMAKGIAAKEHTERKKKPQMDTNIREQRTLTPDERRLTQTTF
jgi:hypothetical protein